MSYIGITFYRERFLVVRFEEKFGEALQEIGKLLAEGKLKVNYRIRSILRTCSSDPVKIKTILSVKSFNLPYVYSVDWLFLNSIGCDLRKSTQP